jgi:hypothetical protein
MKKVILKSALCLCAVAARADIIVISFSGSGTSGTIAPGNPWLINSAHTNDSWGSPGVLALATLWPGSPTPQDITDFTITFTGLPTGVTIDPASLSTGPCGRNDEFIIGTEFCSSYDAGITPFVPWTPTLSNGDDTITWEGGFFPYTILNGGASYFVSIFFTGPVSSVTFTGGWSTPAAVPEPGSLLLLATAAGLCVAVLRRRAARGVS